MVVWLTDWATANGCTLSLRGEVGFGRECVGILREGAYPDYEWDDPHTYRRIDLNGEVWTPEDAYHKHPCVAVLGTSEAAVEQLYEWGQWFDSNGFRVEASDADRAEYADLPPVIVMGLGKHRHVRMVRQTPPTPLRELRDVDCGKCGATLIKDGALQGLAFMVPPEPIVADVRCEACARAEGEWEDA